MPPNLLCDIQPIFLFSNFLFSMLNETEVVRSNFKFLNQFYCNTHF